MTTTISKGIFAFSKLNLSALAASGILLLTAGAAPAQTSEDTAVSAPSGPGAFTTVNLAATPGDGDESSSSLEFISPVRAVTTAPTLAETGGSPLVNPSGTILSGSTVRLPTAYVPIPLGRPQVSALPAAAKASACALLGGGLLALGIVGIRAVQGRSRTLG